MGEMDNEESKGEEGDAKKTRCSAEGVQDGARGAWSAEVDFVDVRCDDCDRL